VVIPAAIRAKAGLHPGVTLDVVLENNSVRLMPNVPRARLVKRRGRLIAVPTAPPAELPSVDVASLVEEERERWPL